MKVGIVGYGHVGRAMKELFPDAYVYDKYMKLDSRAKINKCDGVFVCVPTPMLPSGECDTSAVDEVLSWLKPEVVIIRSTVPVGYTKEASKRFKKDLVFQPEYYGETVDHPFSNLCRRRWITLGGTAKANNAAVKIYQQVYNSDVDFYFVDSKTAELAKYMENAYLATKVTFCNEFYDIAKKLKIDYNELREIWTADPRIGKSHTFVYEDNRGYGGNCLPKDINAITYIAHENGVDATLLEAVIKKNDILKGKSKKPKSAKSRKATTSKAKSKIFNIKKLIWKN